MGIVLAPGEMRSLNIDVHRHFVTAGSTNDLCMELLRECEGNVLVTADAQSEGRGRMKRAWFSPPGGLYFSLGMHGSDPLILPLIAAIAICGSARALGVDARVRWPNDVLAQKGKKGSERKLSGVLIDAKGALAVVGIGVNVKGSSRALPKEVQGIAVTLEELGIEVEPKDLLLDLLWNLKNRQGSDRSHLVKEYGSMCGTLGRMVDVEASKGRKIVGRASRLTNNGFLVVETQEGEVTIDSCIRLNEL
jgi:BirA family biotin operon repressor/biotin-[acetyl-CoA-carboxylase] ligase